MSSFAPCPTCSRVARIDGGGIIQCAICGAKQTASTPLQASALPRALQSEFSSTVMQCPHCHYNGPTLSELAETTVRCPSCRGEFLEPDADWKALAPVMPAMPQPPPLAHYRASRRTVSQTARKISLATTSLVLLIAVGALALYAIANAGSVSHRLANESTTVAIGLGIVTIYGLGALFLYLVPTFIAVLRKHQNAPAIAVLNVLSGWTFVGWVAALVWAFTEVRSRDNYHYHQYIPPPGP